MDEQIEFTFLIGIGIVVVRQGGCGSSTRAGLSPSFAI